MSSWDSSKVIHTWVGDSPTAGLRQLAAELNQVRPRRALDGQMPWINYLTEFFRDPLRKNHVRIDRHFLDTQTLLQTKVDRIEDDGVKQLIAELAEINREHLDHYGGQRLYVALSRLMANGVRRLCSPRLRKRKRPLN